jgi:hypothetical protein
MQLATNVWLDSVGKSSSPPGGTTAEVDAATAAAVVTKADKTNRAARRN